MDYGIDFHKLLNNYNKNIIKQENNEKVLNNTKFKELLKSHQKFEQEVLLKNNWKPIATEQLYENEFIKGFVDVIYSNDENYLIIDYKTVLNINKSFDKYKTELLFYGYLFSEVKGIDIIKIKSGIEMFKQNSSDFNYFLMEINKEELDKIKEDIKNTYDFIITHFKEEDYDKSYVGCDYCEFKDICLKNIR